MESDKFEIEYSDNHNKGPDGSSKRAQYEPSGSQRCKQLICSPRKALLAVVFFVLVAVVIALIAALARQPSPCVSPTPAPAVEKAKPTEAIATTGERFPWTSIRLPDYTTPLTYNLFLHPNLTTFKFKGDVAISLTVQKPSNFIVFHSKNLTIHMYDIFYTENDDGVTVDNTRKIKITRFLEYVNHEQIYAEFDQDLQVGKTYLLKLHFEGVLSNGLMGFYRSSYTSKNGRKRWIASTQFEPTDARAAFPCFDEPSFKANFTLSMVREASYISLFNTQLLRTLPYQETYLEDKFASSVKMSTYLVAFVVCDFAHLNGNTESGINVTVYSPTDLINQASFALETSVKVLDFYEEFYGIKYPLAKSDAIAIPDFAAGAMENWGLVTYLMRSLLYNEEGSSSGDQQFVAVVVSHELAHQWFGNLVTMKWWNDLWLNEAFASYMEYVGVNHVKPDWNMDDQFLVDTINNAMYSDGKTSSHPISVPVQDPAEIAEIFDAISYEKGASIIRMLEAVLGEKVFKAGLHDYLSRHMYQNAETDDLWRSFTKKSRQLGTAVDVKNIMDTWTLQMGYPVVTLSRDGRMVTAEQERFLYNPRGKTSEEFSSPYGYKWEVPLTYTTADDPARTLQWMRKDSVSFQLDSNPAWIKANCNMTGFYRVHYDEENWQAIIDQLNTRHTAFSAADRASLLSDAFALARSGHLDITVAMDLSRYLINETEYVPWSVAMSALHNIGELIEEKPEYNLLKDYIAKLINNRVHVIGWEDKGAHLLKYLRSLILSEAVATGDREALLKVEGIFRDWREGRTQVPANLKSLVYNGAVRHGGDVEWDFVWKKYQEEISPTELHKLRIALAATTDGVKLNRLLYMSMDQELVRGSEMPHIVQAVAANPAGRALAWRFVKNNWHQVMARFGDLVSKLKRIIIGSTSKLTTQNDYDEVKEFLEKNLGKNNNMRAVSQTLEKIMMNIDWLNQNEEKFIQWLKLEKKNKIR